MQIHQFTSYQQFRSSDLYKRGIDFQQTHPKGNYFQSADFFQLIDGVPDFSPLLLLAETEQGVLAGSLFGVIQRNGRGLKAWFSRRLVVWGGPLVTAVSDAQQQELVLFLLKALSKYAKRRSIYIEFRNLFDTAADRDLFKSCGFEYKEHLNYIVATDEPQAVQKRMSNNRRRQIKASLHAGAYITEAQSEGEVREFYAILSNLYKNKVKKPLASLEFFLRFREMGMGKFFIVKLGDKVLGGIVCPVFGNEIIYEWYVCGEDGAFPDVHPSVLATWAPIEYGLRNNYKHFDFMGAGKPDQDYGVREFKARFGGEVVCYGRYEAINNKTLYKIGKLGLQLLHK